MATFHGLRVRAAPIFCRITTVSVSHTPARSALFAVGRSYAVSIRSNNHDVQRKNNARYLSSSNKQPPAAAVVDASSSTKNIRNEITPLSKPSLPTKDEPVDVGVIAERLGVRLTACERDLLKKKLDFNNDGQVTCDSFRLASQRALEDRMIREICL